MLIYPHHHVSPLCFYGGTNGTHPANQAEPLGGTQSDLVVVHNDTSNQLWKYITLKNINENSKKIKKKSKEFNKRKENMNETKR